MLIYIIVVMMIFGIIGGTMVSMFSSSIMMTRGVPNYTRRALYIAESGMRYANNELKNSGYTPAVIEKLNGENNDKQFTLNNNAGIFKLNVFGKWFESSSDFSFPDSETITLNIPEGEIPDGFTIPDEAYVVNLESYRDSLIFGGTPDSFTAKIETDTSGTPLSVDLDDGFQVDQDQTVCLAVHPFSNQSISEAGNSLNVSSEAGDFFPERCGSFYVSTILGEGNVLYYYEEMVPKSGYMELTNLSEQVPEQAASLLSSGFPFDVTTSDYIILSPINHMIISTSTVGSGSSVGNKNLAMDYHQNITDPQSIPPPDLPPDIHLPTDEGVGVMTTENESDTDAINVGSETITLGGDIGNEFGTVFFGGDKEIGGRTDVCVDGKCQFNYGIRIFFLLDYQDDGDGFTIALINGTNNNKTSVGGNVAFGELMGYAGDGSGAISGTPILYPPKIALEFDTWISPDRNDPLSNNQDALQYVFWEDFFQDYDDDNTHDTGGRKEEWAFYAVGDVRSSPAIGSDGTIYVGSNDTALYAINPDGTKKWHFITLGPVESSPLIGPDGNIYVGSNDHNLYVIDQEGRMIASFDLGGKIRSSPAMGLDGTIYVGSDDENVYAISPICNPPNIKDYYYAYENLPWAEQDRITNNNNWLDSVLNGYLWSVRMEVIRSTVANAEGKYEYNLRTWLRQCIETDCSDILETYFQDTRIEYGAKSPHLEQTIELCPIDHTKFDSFLLGLTEATGGARQTAVISKLQLGFIRPGDFVITEDTDWP